MSVRRLDDRGAMLVFALIIITTIALVTGAILTHSSGNFRATVGLRGVANNAYAADTAAKVAINTLRLGADAPGITAPSSTWVYSDNLDGTGCFGLDGTAARNTLVLPGVYPKSVGQSADSSARVECTKVAGTGLFGNGGGVDTNPQNGFKRAITVFNGNLLAVNNSELQVRGGIAVNGNINASNPASIFTNGYARATGSCLGVVTSTPACAGGQATVTDPQVAESISDIGSLTLRNPATMGGCTFQPGYYDNATTLSAKTTSCGVSVFSPGTYYFDFHNDATDPTSTSFMSGTNVWNITNQVIGGTRPSGNPTAVPGSCVSPIDNPSAVGVRFVFGYSSRINIGKDAQVELCGSYSGTEPPVVLQQRMTGTSPSLTTATWTAANVATTGSAPNFSPVPSATTLANSDGTNAKWDGPGNNRTAKLTLTGFNPTTAPPAGSLLKSATLKIKQFVTGGTTPVKVTTTAGTTSSINLPLRTTMPAAPDTIDVTALLQDEVHDGTLTTAAPTVELLLDKVKDMKLEVDSVQLDVAYYPPALRASQNVTFLDGFGNAFKGDFVMQGAIYAPTGQVIVNFGNNSSTVVAFRYGLAVRDAQLAGHPQVVYGYPLVSIPDEGTGLGRNVTVVDLKVYVCAESGGCTSGGTHALTARVKITDDLPNYDSVPVPGKRQIEVLSWAEQR